MQPHWIPDWLSYWLHWAHQEQALLAGMLALLGAGATVWVLYKQIAQQGAQWERSVRRQFRASRAKLPWALSDVTEYTRDVFEKCQNIYERFDEIVPQQMLPAKPTLPTRAIEVIAENIETSDHDEVAKALEEVLSKLQINYARLSETFRKLGREPEVGNVNDKPALAHRGFEAYLLEAYASRLFEYARSARDEPKPLWPKNEAVLGFNFDGESGEYHDEVLKLIKSYWPAESE